jgi:urease accessory protein
MKFLCAAFLSLFALTFSSPAFAHAAGHSNGFLTGFLHPVLGFDHLLAMVAVGIISAQMGGKAIWSVPLAFVCMMVVGGLNGLYVGDTLPIDLAMTIVECGIIASVALLGLAIAMDKNIGAPLAMAFVGFFALFHGFAHGYEAPGLEMAWLYIAGFICGTAVLHIAGVLIGLGSEKLKEGDHLLRHAGSAMLGIGLYMAMEAWDYYSTIETVQ